MNTPADPQPPGSRPRLAAFAKRCLVVPVPAGATIGERTRIQMVNGGALVIGLLGPLFLALNLLGGSPLLALINAASSAVGIASLVLAHRGHFRAAAVLLVIGAGGLFTLSSALFHNGMEYALLTAMFGSIFMFSSFRARFALCCLCSAGFICVETVQFNAGPGAVFPRHRYVANLVIGLATFYLLQETLRGAYAKYQRQIERRSAELQVANQAKEKLFSIVSHDLRGPIGGLRLSLDMLKNGCLTPDEFKALLPDLSASVEHACDSLDTLLVWSASQLRAIKPEPVAVPLAASVESCVRLLSEAAARKGVAVENRVPADLRAWVDENQVLAILRNLLSNALKFTPAGGRVAIDAVPDGAHVRVTVSDTGVGMAPEKIDALFAGEFAAPAYGTAREKGLGLGLAICREFVEANAGRLTVESREGAGTRVHFTLPKSALAPARA